MKEDKKDIAINIVSENMNSLFNKYTEIDETKIEEENIQEKIEVLAAVKQQVYNGNEKIINKVLDKRKMGIL